MTVMNKSVRREDKQLYLHQLTKACVLVLLHIRDDADCDVTDKHPSVENAHTAGSVLHLAAKTSAVSFTTDCLLVMVHIQDLLHASLM